MATEVFANRPSTTVSSGGTTAPPAGTSQTWTVASSASFPAAATSVAQFHVADPDEPSEIILVTNISGTTWTVTRGAESTTPVSHTTGFTVYQVVTAGFLNSVTFAGDSQSLKLQGWYAGLASRHTAQVNVLSLGDSITEGQGATSRGYTYPARLRDMLRARFPTLGLTATGGGGRGYLPPEITSPSPTYPVTWVTVTGSPGQDNGWGINGFTYDLATGGGCTLTYALNATSCSLRWGHRTSGGSFSYTVDGGSPVTISTSAGANADNGETFVPLGASGPHTLVVSYVSGSQVWFTGVIENNGDEAAGIQVHNAGHYGWTTDQWATYFSTSSAAVPAAALAELTPNLIIIELGSNDFNSGRTPAQFQTSMNSLISTLRAAITATNLAPVPPILLMGVPSFTAAGPYTWQDFLDVMYGIAAGDPMIEMLDFSLLMPAYGASQTWNIYVPGGEFSNIGHSWFADILCGFLGPV